jgi:predicted porin
VTAYGIVDAGYKVENRRVDTTTADTAGVGSSAQSSSRIGFKGVEDIGGGTKANFVAEFGLKVTDASMSGSGNDANSSTFDNRQTNVGLSGNLGTVTIGRQYTATHAVIGGSDAGSGNNLIGGTTYVAGNSTSTTAKGGLIATPFYGNSAYVARSSNAVSYSTPAMNGFTLGLGLSKNFTDSTVAAIDSQTRANSIALGYANGPLNVAASKTNLKAKLTNATAGTSVGLMGVMGSVALYDVTQTETALGGSYDLVKAKLFANYLKTEAEGTNGGAAFGNNAKRTAYEMGVQAPVYGAVSAFAKYGKGKTNLVDATNISGATAGSFDFSTYQIGANYALSKRTNAYLIYGSAKADLDATKTAKDTATAIGLRHQF